MWILANPSELNPICAHLSEVKDWQIIESQVTFMPNATVSLTEDQTVSLEKMYDAFSEETNRNLLSEFDMKLGNPITDIVDSFYITKYGVVNNEN